MSVDRIRQRLPQLIGADGKVDPQHLDALMLAARDAGGLDAAERAELLAAADAFDDAGRQRLLSHLATMGQKTAFVNLETRHPLRDTQGRYGTLATDVKGLTVQVGLFDNTFAVSGRARSDGVLRLTVEGKQIEVKVDDGDRPREILEKIRRQLPREVTGAVIGGQAQLHEVATFKGPAATRRDPAAHLVLYKPQALGLKKGERPLRVVVTGYGPFMGITNNPSASMAQRLAEAGLPGAIIEYRRLDVTHASVDRFMDEMKRNPPDVILSMGVDSVAKVEEQPENVVGASADGEGRPIAPGVVRPGAPAVLATDLPVGAISATLRQLGEARKISTSATDPAYRPDRTQYLCNYLGYHLADAFGKTDATTAGFMHITDDTPEEQARLVLEAVVARQLDWRRQRPSPARGAA